MTARTVINSAGVARRFVLKQPPHFRSGQDTKAPVDQVAKEALQALNRCRNERSNPKSAKAAV